MVATKQDLTSSEQGLTGLTVAEAVWIAAATLHLEARSDAPCSSGQIFNRVLELSLTDKASNTIQTHIAKHCVANTTPNPNRVRFLYAVGHGSRRLFRDGDDFDPGRAGSRTHPEWVNLPPAFRHLEQWYEGVWNARPSSPKVDPLLALIGSGRGIWSGTDADTYVKELRDNWGNRG